MVQKDIYLFIYLLLLYGKYAKGLQATGACSLKTQVIHTLIYYLIMPRPKVHGHVTNENGAIACIIEFDNGFLMNIIVHDLGVA